MEVLVTVAISSVIMVPLLAWMTLAYRSQVEVTHNSARTAARNLLAAYLPRDVGAATVVDPDTPTDCAPAPAPAGPAGADAPVLSLTAAGSTQQRTVYFVRPVNARSGVLVRRTCALAGVDDTEVVENVALPTSASIDVSCESACTDRFARVDLRVRLADGRGQIAVTASRRIGSDPP